MSPILLLVCSMLNFKSLRLKSLKYKSKLLYNFTIFPSSSKMIDDRRAEENA